jgi:hypothetical protein
VLEEKDRLTNDLSDAQNQLSTAQILLDERQKERDKVENDLRDARERWSIQKLNKCKQSASARIKQPTRNSIESQKNRKTTW